MGLIVPVKNSIARLPDARNLSARFAGNPAQMADYIAKIQGLFGSSLIGFYPGAEPSDAVALDYSGRGFNGAYTGATLGQPGIGDGLTCPLYDGVNDFMQPPVGFRSAFNNQELTVMIWGIFGAATWADGLVKRLLSFRADANNWVTLAKGGGAGTLSVNYIAGGTNKTVAITTSSPITPFHFAMTVSKSGDEMKAYFGGIQNGATQTGLGIWAGALLATDTLIGAQTTAPAQVCNGSLAHALVLNRAATPAEVAAAAVI
jgi:hypothetical protein